MRQVIAELIDILTELQPASLVYCSAEPIPALDLLAERDCRIRHFQTPAAVDPTDTYDMGVVLDCLEHCSLDQGAQLLGILRNVMCKQLWVVVPSGGEWSFKRVLGFGFKRLNCYQEGDDEICSYSYDIASYNRKRSWNTPQYWANPENWGKYRW